MHLMVQDGQRVGIYASMEDDANIFADMKLGPIEVNQWLNINDVSPLSPSGFWGVKTGLYKVEDYMTPYAEYILTEKQSALFLLRFK